MPLDSLLELVETLRERIDEHGAALRQSETRTRYALIDPLLRGLGWDTGDPSLVVPEYKTDAGSADYALFCNENPRIMVEAKSLGTSLQDAIPQVINYCIIEGTDYFSVTDGKLWEIYETHRRGNITEKRITQYDLKESPIDACVEVLELWQQGVECEYDDAEWDNLFERIRQMSLKVKPLQSHQTIAHQRVVREPYLQSQHASFGDDSGWESLSILNPPPRGRPQAPFEIQFPDDARARLTVWNSVLIETTRWLLENGILKESHCPILVGTTRYILSAHAVHSNGKPFVEPRKIEALWLEVDYSSLDLVRHTRSIIQHVGQNPANFKVRFSS